MAEKDTLQFKAEIAYKKNFFTDEIKNISAKSITAIAEKIYDFTCDYETTSIDVYGTLSTASFWLCDVPCIFDNETVYATVCDAVSRKMKQNPDLRNCIVNY